MTVLLVALAVLVGVALLLASLVLPTPRWLVRAVEQLERRPWTAGAVQRIKARRRLRLTYAWLAIGAGAAVLLLFFVWAGLSALVGDDAARQYANAANVRRNLLATLLAIGAVAGTAYAVVTYRLTRTERIGDRYVRAVAQLGSRDSMAVRVGGVYALERLMTDSPDAQPGVVELLATYVREMAPAQGDDVARREAHAGPAPYVQAALTVLGRRTPLPQERPIDLRATDLRGADLEGAQFDRAILSGAQLEVAKLDGAQLNGASLIGAQLDRAHLFRAQLKGTYLIRAQLEGASLIEARLEGAHLGRAQMFSAFLSGAQLEGADLRRAQLQSADLDRAQLKGADLREAQLQRAQLREAQLAGADLRGAQLEGARLRGVQLENARLGEAQLVGADLREAQLQGARLYMAQLEGAYLMGAQLEGTVLSGAHLRGAHLSRGALTAEQLEQAATPAEEIDWMGEEWRDWDED